MIEFETSYHQKVENTPFYKSIRAIIQDTLDQHLCAGDESQCYDEKIDGIGVDGKEEAAMFIAQFIHKELQKAWADGWRVRDKSCGRSRAEILQKKHTDYHSFREALINDMQPLLPSMNSEQNVQGSDTTKPNQGTKS